MAILKWRDANGKWISLYANWLRNCLRRDKNLSDLTDFTKARENLGISQTDIVSEVDEKYQPIVEQLQNDIKQVKTDIQNKYYIGSTAPSPKEGMIWFDTNAELIKYYKDSAWHIFGSAGIDITKV